MLRRKSFLCGSLAMAALAVIRSGAAVAQPAPFVNFESGHVRPIALSPSHNWLFAVNTPDNRLSIFQVNAGLPALTRVAEVAVGLEPVAVAARTDTEIWVVNHLSDSVSIVTFDPSQPQLAHVVRTLLVCDEPRDIVFAGSASNRAFVTTARRGQNCPMSADTTNALAGRALVQVFDANDLGSTLAGVPLTTIELYGDTPRALARTDNGAFVYAAVFHSGSRTTSISEAAVRSAKGLPPAPLLSPFFGSTNLPGGLIVKRDGSGKWADELKRDWSSSVSVTLPDNDVFTINANTSASAAPAAWKGPVISGVGTVLYNMAVQPQPSSTLGGLFGVGATPAQLFVSNTEAHNERRFEPVLKDQFIDNRLTVVSNSGVAKTIPLDGTSFTPPAAGGLQSLALPTDLVFSHDGARLFVAGFGSHAVEAIALVGTTPITRSLITVGGGPSGLALDEGRKRLYVMNRFDETISVVATATLSVTSTIPLGYDPSPAEVRDGRHFLYDATFSSGKGDAACGSCHVFGDFDSLAWDLGDPFGATAPNNNPFRVGGPTQPFHPMKGPMSTQSLRGMADVGPMHWRGDKTGADDAPSIPPNGGAFDESAGFKKFSAAFVRLLGRAGEPDMQEFADFVLTIKYPPNPIRDLDNSLTPAEQKGQKLFLLDALDANSIPCSKCHAVPLGADGFSSIEGESQDFKIPHLRNVYQKVGMFGSGSSVRGFGYLHDGSVPTPFDFVSNPVFVYPSKLGDPPVNVQQRNVEAFLLAFDTGLRPAVGQQVTATAANYNAVDVKDRIDLLIARHAAGDCDLIAKGVIGGEMRGWLYMGSDTFQSDRSTQIMFATTLRTQAATIGQELTYTCVPPGSGKRIGLDRDLDGFWDRDELDHGALADDPTSTPIP